MTVVPTGGQTQKKRFFFGTGCVPRQKEAGDAF